jgi:hypothetical protein
MANTEGINVVMDEEVLDVAVQAAEVIPVKPNNKFGVIGAVVVGGGAIITGIALGIRYFKNKKKAKEEAAARNESEFVSDDDLEEVGSAEE